MVPDVEPELDLAGWRSRVYSVGYRAEESVSDLIHLTWRSLPAGILMVAGVTFALWHVRQAATGPHRKLRDPQRALGIVRCFRFAVIGLCLAGIGASWNWHIGWLFALSLIIGGEELLESSVHIAALRSGVRGKRRARSIVYAGAIPLTESA